MSDDLEEIMEAFVGESKEHLADIETDLLAIEEGGANVDDDLVNKVYRAAHSIKGGAGFFGLTSIQALTHEMENVLGKIRSHELVPNPEIVNILLNAADTLNALLSDVGSSNDVDVSEHITALAGLLERPQEVSRAPESGENERGDAIREAAPESSAASQDPAASALTVDGPPGPERPAADKKTEGAGNSAWGAGTEASLRIGVPLLDSLMNLAGELVLGRNQLLQSLSSGDHNLSAVAGQRIDLITSELQEAIMQTRMQPIAMVFNKFPRVVRDLARQLEKKIDLVIEGKSVELDKTIIEAINDPLTHLIRNAVDHGIERPEIRRRDGKPEIGRVTIKAFHAAGQVNIEVSDDGKGLDGDKIAAAARDKGLVTDEQFRSMSSREKVNLIFLPGFSTAERVSNVSGRGVGMDVVKTNLDKLGGQTVIESTPGSGSTIRIKLPLTLAIIPSQIVVTEEERYAIPQVNLVELLRVPAAQVGERIEKVGNAEVIRLRGTLLPLVRLADVLGVQRTYRDNEGARQRDRRAKIADRRSRTSPAGREETPERQLDPRGADLVSRNSADRRYRAASALNVAVVSSGVIKYGLIVDQLLDSEEIVVKPLGRHLKHCKGYAGATIMGDGRVALILDVGNLAIMAGLASVEGTDRALQAAIENAARGGLGDKQSLLLFRGAEDEHFAVPLGQVERIEKIRTTDIQTIGDRRVIKYRGGSLPLFSVDEVAQVKPIADNAERLVLVFTLAGREIGLLAAGPVDAVQVSVEVDTEALRQPGILGSAIVKDTTTLWVDMYELVQTLKPHWLVPREAERSTRGRTTTVLYAEDSKFFRDQVERFIEEAGYTVIAKPDGAEAWQFLHEHPDDIDLVVTDIEMPNLNGFEFAEKINLDSRFKNLPVIALTTLAEDADIARAKTVGIDDYQIKMDREKLITSLARLAVPATA